MRGSLHGIREAWYCVTDSAATRENLRNTAEYEVGREDPGSGSEGGHGAERCGRWGCEDTSLSGCLSILHRPSGSDLALLGVRRRQYPRITGGIFDISG